MSRVRDLKARSVNLSLYVMYRRFTELKPEHLPDHLDWVVTQEKLGTVFAAGPFVNGDGAVSDGSLIVFRASSMSEAEALAESDPLVSGGSISYELHEWNLLEGSISLQLEFSDKSVRFV